MTPGLALVLMPRNGQRLNGMRKVGATSI